MTAQLSSGNVSVLEQEYDQQVQALLETMQNPEYAIPPLAQRDLKNHISSMYSVFVQTIGKAAEQQHTINRHESLIRHLNAQHNDDQMFRHDIEKKLVSQMEVIQESLDRSEATNPVLLTEVRETMTTFEDISVWQQRIRRIAEENEELFDKISNLQGELMDTQFSNQSLKTELCGRIQQLQLMSKGLTSPGDKMYQRVLHEMEQNSMKAYAQHGRKISTPITSKPAPETAPTPTAAPTFTPAAVNSDGAKQDVKSESAQPSQQTPPAQQRKPPYIEKAPNSLSTPPPKCAVMKLSPQLRDTPKYRRVVQIKKKDGSLGLRISGGVISGVQFPVMIQGVEPGKQAAESGQVYAGDWIVEAVGTSTEGLDHEGLVKLLASAGDVVDFVLRSNHIPSVPTTVDMCDAGGFAVADIGRRVQTESGLQGVVKFVGIHAMERKGPRVGLELDTPSGKNSGIIEGYKYFDCEPNHGLLTVPTRITFVHEETETDAGSESEVPLSHAVQIDSASDMDIGADITDTSAPDESAGTTTIPVLHEDVVDRITNESFESASPSGRASEEVADITKTVHGNIANHEQHGTYSPAPGNRYSTGLAVDVASVQQTAPREDSSLFGIW